MTRDDIIAQVQRNITFGQVPDGYRPDPAQLWPYSLSGGAESYGAESPSRVSPAQARAYGGTSRGGGGFPFPLLGGGMAYVKCSFNYVSTDYMRNTCQRCNDRKVLANN